MEPKLRRRAWQAVCHEVIGAAVGVEAQVDWTLALAHGGSQSAVRRLSNDVFPRLGGDVKQRLLEQVMANAHRPDGVAAEFVLPFCVPGIRHLSSVRNTIAHSRVDDTSTDEMLVLAGRNRGASHTKQYTYTQINYLRQRLVPALHEDLFVLGRWSSILDDREQLGLEP